MDFDLAEYAVNLARDQGCSYAEARLDEITSTGFSIKNGVTQISGFDKVEGLGIRFIIKDSMGFASINNLNKAKIRNLIKNSIKITNRSSKINETIKLSEDKTHVDKYEIPMKINFADVQPEEKLQILLDAEKEIQSTKVDVIGRYMSLSDTITEEYIYNSDGTKILAKVPGGNFFYFLTVKNANKTMQRFWQYGQRAGFEIFKKWDTNKIVRDEVESMNKILKEGKKVTPGNYDFVCGPQVVGIMVHESVGHPYEADRICGREAAQAGESFVTKDMLKTKIGSDLPVVVDDPTIENSNGYYLYDNEGVKAREKVLMKNGIINEFLHNRETAAALGTTSNGSARATEYDRECIVRMSNTYLKPGKQTEEELISGVKKGIYMKNFMEWNIDDKRYSQKYVGAESYLIENGKITKPVINPIIEITTPNLWKAVDGIANNMELHAGTCGKGEPMQGIPVSFGGASMRLRNLRLQ